jgi:hypothetical protein
MDFDFGGSATRIKDRFNEGNCYKLVCSAEVGEYKLRSGKIATNYCFSKDDTNVEGMALRGADSCNPFAAAKFENGRCRCPFPYTGD